MSKFGLVVFGVRFYRAPARRVARAAGALIMAAALCFSVVSHAAAQSFQLAIEVTDGTNTRKLILGVSPNATDGPDEGLDQGAPPPPPSGAFDVRSRLGSEDYFIDFRGEEPAEKEFEILYQAGLDGGPIVLRWDTSGLAAVGTFEIVDAFTGSLFGPLDMTSTNQFDVSTGGEWVKDGLVIRMRVTNLPTAIDKADDLPRSMILEPNYPNPFNPQTTIRFQLGGPERVTLKVFDMLGRPVATLLDAAHRSAGSHQVVFRADNLPSGVYLYTLEGSGVRFSRQMLLQK